MKHLSRQSTVIPQTEIYLFIGITDSLMKET